MNNNLVEQADSIKYAYLNDNLRYKREENSQFFSSLNIALFMANLFNIDKQVVKILDPGAGTGILSAALIQHLINNNTSLSKIELTAIEKDEALIESLNKTYNHCYNNCKEANVDFEYKIINQDFIEYGYSEIINSSKDNLFYFDKNLDKYDAIILNPPYKKIENSSKVKNLLNRIQSPSPNIYTAFLSICQFLIKDDGQLVAITPRSFCNGTYYKEFRKSFFSKLFFHRIHIYNQRNTSFKEDDVLQENIIFKVTPIAPKDNLVNITTSDSPLDNANKTFFIESNKIILPFDKNKIIHVITDDYSLNIIERITTLNNKMNDIKINVSTGKVVDFRLNEFLEEKVNNNSAPLLYPFHFSEGEITYPNNSKKKKEAIKINTDTEKFLIPAGYYVFCKRFSAKEEKKRIVASVFNPLNYKFSLIGIENHINYFHSQNKPLEKDVAYGLSIYLNSTIVDQYFRLFNGHTQVNADDLRYLPYPSIAQLKILSKYHSNGLPDQNTIDSIIEKELFKMAKNQNPTLINDKIVEALDIIKQLGLPKEQQNERSALVLLALLNLKPEENWDKAKAIQIGITPIMDFIKINYKKEYAANTRETIRKDTVHHFVQAGLLKMNPDDPTRPINSPNFAYKIEDNTLNLIRKYKKTTWTKAKKDYFSKIKTLIKIYAQERKGNRIPLQLAEGKEIYLSPGGQNKLIKKIIKEFCPYYTPSGNLLYIGDAGAKFKYYNKDVFRTLNIEIEDQHGKMPDVIVYYIEKRWLVLIEAVVSNGPIDAKRKIELEKLFAKSKIDLVFITAFLDKKTLSKFVDKLAWETDVWVAENPTHLVHFNGKRFLGPYVKD